LKKGLDIQALFYYIISIGWLVHQKRPWAGVARPVGVWFKRLNRKLKINLDIQPKKLYIIDVVERVTHSKEK